MKIFSDRELDEKMHFDTFAKEYDFNYQYNKPFTKYKIDKKSDEFVRLAEKNLKQKNLRILEIGCGTGEYTKHLAQKLPKSKIIGLDISDKMIKIAKAKCKKYPNTSFVVNSAYDTGFKPNSFDVVCGFYVLHHLEIFRIRKELKRILKPGGIFFFYEPNILNPVVYLIKSSKMLKRLVGDSPDEWAINPLVIKKQFPSFDIIEVSQTEFIWPFNFIPLNILKAADKVASYLRFFPLLKYFGGSVELLFKKQ